MRAALFALGFFMAQPLLASSFEQQCKTAGEIAVRAKRLMDRGENPATVADLLPATKVEEEAVNIAINNRGFSQDDLRFYAANRCHIYLNRQKILRERSRLE